MDRSIAVWTTIREFLTRELADEIPSGQLKAILDLLEQEKHGKRLAISLALDLKNGAIKRPELARILKSIDPETAVCPQFQSLTPGLQCTCDLPVQPLDPADRYVRVLNLNSAHTYYVNPNMPGYTMDSSDLKDAKEQLAGWQKKGIPPLIRTYSGYRNVVWVTRWTKVDPVLPREDAATQLNDRLGLALTGEPPLRELWAFCYPHDFFIVCRRPTTFDASWSGDAPFLPAARPTDEWGQTHPCKKGSESLPERVHAGFDGYMHFFSVHHVGLAEPLEVDWDDVLASGFDRFGD